MRHRSVHLPLVFAALAVLLATVPGCATIFSGSQSYVLLETRPPGAEVYVDGQPRGRTPMEVGMRSSSDHTVQLRRPGYQDVTVQLFSSFNAVSLWNIFVWPGFLIDLATGAIWETDQDEIRLELLPLPGAVSGTQR